MTNVETVLGQLTDPALPVKAVDVAFFRDVLHHIEDRAGYLKALARYIGPSGRIAVIDFEAGMGPHRNQPELQVTRDQLTRWMRDTGFAPRGGVFPRVCEALNPQQRATIESISEEHSATTHRFAVNLKVGCNG